MRRISVWLGLGLLALACLAFVPWAASAYGVHTLKAVPAQGGAVAHDAAFETAWQAPELGVPLRANWWQTIPGVDRATKLNLSLENGWPDSPSS